MVSPDTHSRESMKRFRRNEEWNKGKKVLLWKHRWCRGSRSGKSLQRRSGISFSWGLRGNLKILRHWRGSEGSDSQKLVVINREYISICLNR